MREPEEEVKRLLALIEQEKAQPVPDRRQMRLWFNRIVQIKEDWRVVETGQDNRYQNHTSMRSCRDDIERRGE